MKKIMLIAVILLSIGFTQHVFAQGFVPLASIPGLTDIQPTQGGLADFFNNLYKYLIGLAAILAIIEIIWGGLEISTKDSVSKQSDGKERITQAIFGLVLVLSPVLVFSIINPSILNLSLNMPELDTKSGMSAGSVAGTQTSVTDAPTGCSVIGTSGILQIATCPSNTTVKRETDRCGSSSGQSSIISQNTLTDGTIVSTMLMCAWSNKYVFIDTRNQGVIGWIASKFNTINDIQPLAITSDNSNNGNFAIQFMNTCSSSGLSTCIRDTTFTYPIECTPTPKTSLSGPARKCGVVSLTCEDYNSLHTVVASLCSKNPSWRPFQ